MTPIQWDNQETFIASSGATAIRYAMSMHDATIRSLLPADFWIPVHAAPVTNAKIERVHGRLVVLCGFNKPDDPLGNLVLIRVATAPGFSRNRLATVTAMILMTLAGFGIQPDKHMTDIIRGN